MNGYNFTDRVRKVLHVVRQEANRLHHEYVGTEHILLGLIREGEGVAVAVLTNLYVDLEAIQRKIEETVKQGKAVAESGRDLPYTSRAKKVLELAMAEARELNHSYVGTEHLLLGLLRERLGIAAQVLVDAKVDLEKARAETLRLLGAEMPSTPAGGGTGAQPPPPLSELTLTPCPLCKTGAYTLDRVRLTGNAIKSPHDMDFVESWLAGITFRPWIVRQGQSPADCPRRDWSLTIEYLQRKSPIWLERLFQATIRDGDNQVVTRVAITKPEGGLVYDAMDGLCRQLKQWWVAPDHGGYSVDWLCGYIGRYDTTRAGEITT